MRLTGRIVSNLRPEVTLDLETIEGTLESRAFLIDTGCTVELVMPYVEIIALGWQPLYSTTQVRLVVGGCIKVDTYAGTILLGGIKRPVTVLALGTDRIIGMELLQAWQLCIDIELPDQGEVRLQPLGD